MSAGTQLSGTPTPTHYWEGAGGVRIAGDSWGDPAGPLVLLQHGGGQTRHAWKGAGKTLGAAGYFAVAFDARGHGDSDWAALVLVDIAPRIEAGGVDRIQAFMTRNPDGFGSLQEVAEAIASYQPHRARPRNLDGLGKNVRLGPDGRYRWHWDPRFRAARPTRDCPRCWCAAGCPIC